MKRVSKGSGVHIVCSTGFYYNDEPVMERLSAETIGEYIVADAKWVNTGIIKAAAESTELTEFNITLLRAAAYAQRRLGLPIVLHTNAVNRNGRKAAEVLLNEGVAAKCIERWQKNFVLSYIFRSRNICVLLFCAQIIPQNIPAANPNLEILVFFRMFLRILQRLHIENIKLYRLPSVFHIHH